jgi:outer membrane biosynthesis protein TonB
MRNLLLCGAAALALSAPSQSAAQVLQRRPGPAPAAGSESWVTTVYLLDAERLPADAAQSDDARPERRTAWRELGWIRPDDLPEELRRRALGTTTHLRIDIDAAGRVGACSVLRPSSEPRLDRLACRLAGERLEMRPFYIGPGRPVASRWTLAIGWQNGRPGVDAPAFEPPPPMPPPPPPPPGAYERGLWPRLGWGGHVVAASLPRIQDAFPQAARRNAGVVALELSFTVQAGITGCTIVRGSGDAALDEAACGIARSLDLRYAVPCEFCSPSPLPLQVVWNRRGGSHVRLPLFSSYYPAGWPEQPRDPADTRTARRYGSALGLAVLPFTTADFARIRDRAMRSRYFWAEIIVSPQGRITGCVLRGSTGNPQIDARICRILLRRTHAVRTDVFGDPAEARETVALDLRGVE